MIFLFPPAIKNFSPSFNDNSRCRTIIAFKLIMNFLTNLIDSIKHSNDSTTLNAISVSRIVLNLTLRKKFDFMQYKNVVEIKVDINCSKFLSV